MICICPWCCKAIGNKEVVVYKGRLYHANCRDELRRYENEK